MSVLPSPEQKAEFVRTMFDGIASKYDLMNDLITVGLHRLWKEEVCKRLNLTKGLKVLDLCCGTGDLSVMLLKSCLGAEIVGLDFSEDMLSFARKRMEQASGEGKIPLSFVQGDALNLPFPEREFDRVVISFGLRNVADYERCLREAFRVCKDGGKLVILDLSHPSGFWDWISRPYRYCILPFLGKLIAANQNAYAYLPLSIQSYPTQSQLVDLMGAVGWKRSRFNNLFGGLLAFHEGYKED